MNQYEQDMRTQTEYNKKKDDKLEKGMIAAAAILGGIALYNAATNRTVPNETLKSIFDDKLSPNIAKSGDTVTTPDVGTQQFKIISGGQTGSDTYGLQIAKELGIATGGTAPVGYKRNGNDGINVKDFGLIEITPEQQDAFTKMYGLTDPWTGRTYYNGKNSDATLWFGKYHGPGYKATQRGAGTKFIDADVLTDAELLSKLKGMHTINIAGSEMKNIQKGEEAAIKERLRRILPQLLNK